MGQLQNPGSQVRISLPSKWGRPKPILTLQYHGPPSSRWSLVARVTGGGARGPAGLQAHPLAAGGERQQLPSWGELVMLLGVPAEPSTHLRKRKRRKQQQQQRLLQHYTLHVVCATTWLKDAQMLTQACPMLGGGRWLCWACFEQEKGSVSQRVSSSPCTASLLLHSATSLGASPIAFAPPVPKPLPSPSPAAALPQRWASEQHCWGGTHPSYGWGSRVQQCGGAGGGRSGAEIEAPSPSPMDSPQG